MDANLKCEVARILSTWHRGPGRAIPRRALLEILEIWGLKISDRTLRRVYGAIPNVCYSCGGPRRGLYWSDDEREIRTVINRERSRGLACMVRGAKMRKALAARGQGILLPAPPGR